MRGLSVGQIEHDLIDVTPAPSLRRIITFDDGMLSDVKMLGGMFVGRIVAATDMAAGPANPQMQPDVAGLQTLFTTERTWRDSAYAGDMLAGHVIRPNQGSN